VVCVVDDADWLDAASPAASAAALTFVAGRRAWNRRYGDQAGAGASAPTVDFTVGGTGGKAVHSGPATRS
jgi:hypothetical protein